MWRKKIVITGGHLTPALALIEKLQIKNWQIYYFGRKKAMQRDKQLSLEANIIPQMGIQFIPILTDRFRKHIDLENILALCRIPVGILHSFYWLMRIRPQVIVSFGGYMGPPVVISAWILRIPIVIHEQTGVAGLANRLSAPFAHKIAISFPSSKQFYFPGKVLLTGNPVQNGIFKVDQIVKKKYSVTFNHRRTLLVIGGNQGAKIINKTILNVLPEILKNYNLIHQIGSVESQTTEWETAQQALKNLPRDLSLNYYPIRFIPYEEMGTIYSLVDLVISRAGANTVSELGVLQKPSILIPLEPSLMNEQLLNAKLLVDSGLAKLLRQQELSTDTLIIQIKEAFDTLNKFKLKSEYKNIFVKDAAKNLYDIVESVL